MISQIITMVITLVVFAIAMLKYSSTGEQSIMCLIFFVAAGIHHHINQTSKASLFLNLETMKNTLKLRAQMGDEEAVDDYKEYIEISDKFLKSGKIMIMTDIYLLIITILSIFFLFIADNYQY